MKERESMRIAPPRNVQPAARKVVPAVFDTITGTPIVVTATGGTMGPTVYPTLKAAFDAINAGTHQAAITISVTGNTAEAASAVLNNSGAGAASYTSVSISPSGGPQVITGSIVGAVIKLNGADNVTIDGRIAGSGRNLTVSNTSTATATAAIWLASVAAGNGCTNNVIRNLEIAAGATSNLNANSTFGVIMGGTTISTAATDGNDNDNNSFIANRVTKCRYGIATRGTTTNANLGLKITDNIIGPTSFGADEIGKVGIFLQADSGALITRNIVQFVGGDLANTTAGADRMGIAIGNESWSMAPTTITSNSYTVTRNIVHDVIEERTFSSVGINLATTGGGAATNNLVANNFVYNVRANGTAGDQSVGIGIAGGHTDSVVFNSVSMTGDVDPGAAVASAMFGSGIRIANASGGTHANLTLKDNSVYMDLSSSSTAANRYYAISGPINSYAFGTGGEDNNNLYINPANPQTMTGGLGTVSGSTLTTQFATLANWQTAYTAPQDAASIQADPQYVSNTADLHIAGASPNVNAGVAAGGVTKDIDNEFRVAPPDIGADEPGGVTPPVNDMAAAAIVNPPNGSQRPAGVPFSVQASFTNVGTASQTNVPVRFRILDGMAVEVYNQTGNIPAIDEDQTVTVTFPNATLAAGAYTTIATAELPGDTNAANDTVMGTLNVANPLSGSYNVGAGGDYTSLTNPGGAFDAINGLGGVGTVTFNITSDLTGEGGTIALNEVQGGASVIIKPTGAARSITGSSTTNIIRINGADNVTINGSLGADSPEVVGGDPSIRNLTITNTNTTATAGAVVAIVEGTNGALNCTVKNTNISGQDPTQTLIGIHIGGNAPGSAPVTANNNNAVVENCSFVKSFVGVFNDGISGANAATGNVITMNDISGTGTSRVRRVGIFMFNHNGVQVTENNVSIPNSDESADGIAIAAGIQNVTTTAVTGGGMFNSLISRNRLNAVSTSTVGFSAVGIALAGDPAGTNTISNNMIYGVIAPSTSPDIVAGVFVAGVTGTTTRVHHNSVSMTGDRGAVASQIGSFALAMSGATTPSNDVQDNILMNTQTSSGGVNAKSYVMGTTATTGTMASLTSNFNLFFNSGAQAAGFRTGSLDTTGTDFANLAAWQAASGKDAASLSGDPLFVSTSNLHIGCTSPAVNTGTSVGVTIDYDSQARDAMPDIGADELVAPLATSVVSRKIQGGTPFDIALPGVECRTGGGGGNFQVIFNFAGPTTVGGATSSAGTVDMVSGSGTNSITVDLSGVPNATNVTVSLTCASDSPDGSGNVSVVMGVLLGDTNGNGAVNSSDVSQTKGRLGQVLDSTNFRNDVNANGAISSADVSQVKANVGTGLP